MSFFIGPKRCNQNMSNLEPIITSNSRKRVKVVIKTAKAAKFIDIALQTV